MCTEVLGRFECGAIVTVVATMAWMALEYALPSGLLDEVFEQYRQRQ